MNKCSVCGNKLKEDYSYYDGDLHTTVEYSYTCTICGYSEEYAYGCGRDGVPSEDIQFGYSYSDKSIDRNKGYKIFKNQLWKYRKKMLRVGKIKGRTHNI